MVALKSPLIVVLLFVVTMMAGSISALQCYSCEGRETDMCGRNPTLANRVTCAANELCNVLRTERTDSFGRTVTYSRGCRQSTFAGSQSGNGVNSAQSSQSCSTDLCNTGDGMGPGGHSGSFNLFNQGHNHSAQSRVSVGLFLVAAAIALMAF